MFTATRDAEAKLVEMVGGIKDEASSWRGVHFQFAQLLEGYRNDYQIKIAVNLINDLLKIHQGGLFVCQDSSIYIVCRNVTKAQLDKVIFQLRYLFMDDPLAYNADGQENPDFCRIYDLSVEWEKFNDHCRKKLARLNKMGAESGILRIEGPERSAPSAKAAAIAAMGGVQPAAAPAAPSLMTKFNPKVLASLEQDLRNADLTRVLRRQPVCAALPNASVRRVFDETYINIAHLRKLLRSDADLLSNRWLFKYLTQVLDERVLDLLRHNPRYLDSPLSLNFNVDTLLGEAFTAFDAGLKPAVKISIVLELQIADVFGDMQAFKVAKETVQRLGYRICLDGLTNLSFTHMDRERLGFDLVKLQWSPGMEADTRSRENRLLQEAIQKCGANRVILCRCDGKQAVEFGQSIGISLFQGRYLDKLINPTSTQEN